MCQQQQQQHTHLRDNLAQLLQLRDDEHTECQYCSVTQAHAIGSRHLEGSLTLLLLHLPCITRQHHTHSDCATLHQSSPDTHSLALARTTHLHGLEPREIVLLNLYRMLRNAAGSGEVMDGKHTLSAAGAGAASSATAVGASRVTASARTCNDRTASIKTESCKAAIDMWP